MMKIRDPIWLARLTVWLLVVSLFLGFAAAAERARQASERPEIALGVPGEYLERHGYILGKPGHCTPWVAEHLTKASFVERAKRDDFTFYADDEVPSEFRATLADYAGRKFDRGHMAPARDMVHSAMAMRDAYRLSNMMPQTPELNRGEWKRLEEHIAKAVGGDDTEIWVFTGPAWLPHKAGEIKIEVLGEHQVWIPSHCWKAVLWKPPANGGAKGDGRFEMHAWLLPNIAHPPAFDECKVSVDEIEAITGLDLFAGLLDKIEDDLEAAK